MDAAQRKALYLLMIVVATGFMTARLVNVENVYDASVYKAYGRAWPKETPTAWPTFGSNDRSRWATVRALVDEDTFAIGERSYPKLPAYKDTGMMYEYAFTVFRAAQNRTLYKNSGILFEDGFTSVDVVLHPDRKLFYATKPPLLTLVATSEYWFLKKVCGWNIVTHRFEVTIVILLTINVLPLALAWLLFARLVEEYGTTDWGRLFTVAVACFGTFLPTFAITLNNHVPGTCCVFFSMYLLLRSERFVGLMAAGLLSGMAVCLDLPAAAFTGIAAVILVTRSWAHALIFGFASLVPFAAQTIVNYYALGTWLPVYAQFGGPWYEYPGSHWSKRHAIPKPTGIDFIDEPKSVYAFHLLFGHHGLFSLTPAWLLSFVSIALPKHGPRTGVLLMRLMPLLAAVVVGFYIVKTNNYGGWTCGPRWLFWLTPAFLLCLLPTADRLSASRLGRGIAYACLGVAAFSTMYPFANPWRHPWIHQWCRYMGWITY